MSKFPDMCVFCGADRMTIEMDEISRNHQGHVRIQFFIKCRSCKAQGPKCDTREDAIESWNGVYC